MLNYTPLIRAVFRVPGFSRWYASRVRFHEYGLLPEDVIVERPLVAKVVASLPSEELAARNFRLKRAQAMQVTQSGSSVTSAESRFRGYLYSRMEGVARQAKEEASTRG